MPPEAVMPLPLVLIGAAATLGSAIVWGIIARRLATGRQLIPFEPRRSVPWNGFDLLMVLAVLWLLSFAAHRALAIYHGGAAPDVMGPPDLAASMAAELGTLVFALGLMWLSAGATAADLGFRPPRIGYDFALGGLAYLAAVAPISALQMSLEQFRPYEHPLIESYRQHPGPGMLAISLALAVVVAPLCEEFFFRVLLQGWLETITLDGRNFIRLLPLRGWPRIDAARRAAADGMQNSSTDVPDAIAGLSGSEDAGAVMPNAGQPDDPNPYRSPAILDRRTDPPDIRPKRWPIVASSTIFALAHWGQGLAPIPLFFLALVLGYLYQRTHRIWPSLVVHALLNGGSMLILWLAVRANPA